MFRCAASGFRYTQSAFQTHPPSYSLAGLSASLPQRPLLPQLQRERLQSCLVFSSDTWPWTCSAGLPLAPKSERANQAEHHAAGSQLGVSVAAAEAAQSQPHWSPHGDLILAVQSRMQLHEGAALLKSPKRSLCPSLQFGQRSRTEQCAQPALEWQFLLRRPKRRLWDPTASSGISLSAAMRKCTWATATALSNNVTMVSSFPADPLRIRDWT